MAEPSNYLLGSTIVTDLFFSFGLRGGEVFIGSWRKRRRQ